MGSWFDMLCGLVLVGALLLIAQFVGGGVEINGLRYRALDCDGDVLCIEWGVPTGGGL